MLVICIHGGCLGVCAYGVCMCVWHEYGECLLCVQHMVCVVNVVFLVCVCVCVCAYLCVCL